MAYPDLTTVIASPASIAIAGATTTTSYSDAFTPEIWKDEMVLSRENKLALVKHFKRLNHKGSVGDTVYLMLIDHMSAVDKAAGVEVDPQTLTTGRMAVTIDSHKTVSVLIEDMASQQSIVNIRREFTREGGYALAKALEDAVWTAIVAGLHADYKVVGADGSTAFAAGNFSDITDAGLRKAIQTLEDNNTDMGKVKLFIPPSQKNALLGIDKFTLYNYIGRTSELQRGEFGNIYGIPVVVTTNAPHMSDAGAITTAALGTGRLAMLASSEAVCVAPQWDVRFQSQYEVRYLGTRVVGDMCYGIKCLRVSNADLASPTAASSTRLSEIVGLYVK